DGDNLMTIEVGDHTGDCDLMALDDFDVLEGLTVEIYKDRELLGSFEWGGSFGNYSLVNDDGILALVS
ncbi:MAG: hypothetical protein AB7F40_11625, partial [Victivallaceae bacterium]